MKYFVYREHVFEFIDIELSSESELRRNSKQRQKTSHILSPGGTIYLSDMEFTKFKSLCTIDSPTFGNLYPPPGNLYIMDSTFHGVNITHFGDNKIIFTYKSVLKFGVSVPLLSFPKVVSRMRDDKINVVVG